MKETRIIKRSFCVSRNEVICTLENFMSSHFELVISYEIRSRTYLFRKLTATDKDIHNTLGCSSLNTSLLELADQYETISKKEKKTSEYRKDMQVCFIYHM